MKKLLVALLVVVALFALVGCGKTGDCEMCGKKDVSLEEVEENGASAYVCEDCAKLFEVAEDLVDDALDALS